MSLTISDSELAGLDLKEIWVDIVLINLALDDLWRS